MLRRHLDYLHGASANVSFLKAESLQKQLSQASAQRPFPAN